MATASTSWMPVAGRHNVSIGSSLSKALKARKGQPPTQRSKALPDRDFYALRYNHKPASIDPTKSGTLEVTPGREVTTVRVERPTVNNNEVIVFKGEEKPAKEWECVLIYDEATQTFTLEKLDSLVNLNFDAKAPPRTRPAAPSPPSASSSSAAQTPRRSPVRTAADELEAQLEGASVGLGGVHYPDEDADGEPDPSFSLAQGREQEEVTGAAPPPRRSSSTHHRKAAPPAPQAPQAAQQSKARPTPSSKKSALASQSAKAARVSAANAQPTPAPAPSSSSSLGSGYVFSIERVACKLFGLVAYGVHMTVYEGDANAVRVWVPRRAATKPTYPGMLDNSVAGGITGGMSAFASIVKEAGEEASLDPELVRKRARGVGALSYFYQTQAGWLQPKVDFVYDMRLEPGEAQLVPGDGEVESFVLMSVDEVVSRMRAGEFKPNCALVLLDFLVRHGYLTPENEPRYLEINQRLHGRFDLERW